MILRTIQRNLGFKDHSNKLRVNFLDGVHDL